MGRRTTPLPTPGMVKIIYQEVCAGKRWQDAATENGVSETWLRQCMKELGLITPNKNVTRSVSPENRARQDYWNMSRQERLELLIANNAMTEEMLTIIPIDFFRLGFLELNKETNDGSDDGN